MKVENETQAILAAGASLAEPKNINGIPVVLAPEGYQVRQLIELAPQPARKTGFPQLTDLSSFIAYVRKFKTPETVIFISGTKTPEIKAIFDYNGDKPGWSHHGVIFKFAATEEYLAWLGVGKMNSNRVVDTISQEAFVEFLEDFIHTIADPDGATLKEICANLQATREQNISNVFNTQNGDVQVVFAENTTIKGAKKDMTIPSVITLGLSPFLGMPPYKVELRLKTRIKEGKLTFAVKFNRLELLQAKIVEDAIIMIKNQLKDTPVYLGSDK